MTRDSFTVKTRDDLVREKAGDTLVGPAAYSDHMAREMFAYLSLEASLMLAQNAETMGVRQ